MGNIGEIPASGAYEQAAFFTGLLEGYNTMDVLAGLAFGIVVVDVIRSLGVKEPGEVAANTVKAGAFSALLMAVIYVLVTVVGAQSRGGFPAAVPTEGKRSRRSQNIISAAPARSSWRRLSQWRA